MNVKKCVLVTLIVIGVLLAAWFVMGERRGQMARPSEPVMVRQVPVARPVQAGNDGGLQRLWEECDRLKRELVEANAKVVALTVANEKAETLNASLTEQVKTAEKKMERMTTRQSSLHSWLTVVSIAGVVGFFVGISMGSSTRRAFVTASKGGTP